LTNFLEETLNSSAKVRENKPNPENLPQKQSLLYSTQIAAANLWPDTFHKSFLGTEVSYKYNTYHILDHSEEALLSMDNPFSLIVLPAQKALLRDRIPEEELGEERLTIGFL
jgi:hypothetical protein